MTTHDHAAPEFWIDVGGTFTDCFVRFADGRVRRHKLLSTAVTKGSCAAGSSPAAIVDNSRQHDPAEIWTDCRLRLVDSAGRATATVRVSSFASGILQLDPPLPTAPIVGQSYEILSDEEAPTLAIR